MKDGRKEREEIQKLCTFERERRKREIEREIEKERGVNPCSQA